MKGINGRLATPALGPAAHGAKRLAVLPVRNKADATLSLAGKEIPKMLEIIGTIATGRVPDGLALTLQ